jgi:hypothetical protein
VVGQGCSPVSVARCAEAVYPGAQFGHQCQQSASAVRWRLRVARQYGMGRNGVSEVKLVLLAHILRAMDRRRTIGQKLAKTRPVITRSRKQVRPRPLLRMEGVLQGEVRRGFEKLGLTGCMRGTIALTPQGASQPPVKEVRC